MRSVGVLTAAIFALTLPAAHADVVTYDLTLNAPSPFSVLGSGTGTFSVQLSPNQASDDQMGYSTPYFPGSGLLSFTATIAGETYTPNGGADVYLEDGQVTELEFTSENSTLTGIDDLLLDNSTFTLLRDVPVAGGSSFESEEGSITVTEVTPEPGSLPLVATGLFALLGVARSKASGNRQLPR